MILGAIIFFIFGTIIGSFLNVVILRYNTGRSAASGRSACSHCRHELGVAELVPVLSFLFLGGRCKHCGSRLSWQYPVVEFFTGLIFAMTFWRFGDLFSGAYQVSYFICLTFLIIDLIVFSLLIIIFVYDLKHKIIPDAIVYAFSLVSLLKLTIFSLFFLNWSLSDFLAGPIMFIPFFLLWYLSKGRWMGLGDAKLSLGMGWFLGLISSLSAIILAFWIGAVVGILLLFFQFGSKKLTIKSEIPFAPFLILGLLLVFFWRFDVLSLSTLFVH